MRKISYAAAAALTAAGITLGAVAYSWTTLSQIPTVILPHQIGFSIVCYDADEIEAYKREVYQDPFEIPKGPTSSLGVSHEW